MAVDKNESRAIEDILMVGGVATLPRMCNERFKREKRFDDGDSKSIFGSGN